MSFLKPDRDRWGAPTCGYCWGTGVIGIATGPEIPAPGQYPCWYCRPKDVEPPDEWNFVRPLLKDPNDDTARLVYCDWLEEQGRGDRALFIRESLELARLAGSPTSDHYVEVKAGWMSDVDPFSYSHKGCRICQLALRWKGEHKPVRTRIAKGLAGLTGLPPDWSGNSNFTRRSLVCGIHCYKGFAGGLYLPLEQFMSYGLRVFTMAPIEHVVLIDRKPMPCDAINGQDWEPVRFVAAVGRPTVMWIGDDGRLSPRYMFQGGAAVPMPIFELLEGGILSDPDPGRLVPQRAYPNKWEAIDAMSDACVRFMRGYLLPCISKWEERHGVPG